MQNNDGYFVFRYLLVDIPSAFLHLTITHLLTRCLADSRTRQRTRVFVERAPGVSEHEPVMHIG
jgi:import inner membrane translocase subunit TIM21